MQTILVFLVLLSASPAYVLSYYAGLRSMPLKPRILLPSSSSTSLFAKKTFKVTVVHDGLEKVIDVKEGEPILMAALDAGIDLPHDCDMGVCLTCPSRIVSGEVDQTGGTLDQSVIDQGFALTCCAYPLSDVTIRSIDEEELLAAQFGGRESGELAN